MIPSSLSLIVKYLQIIFFGAVILYFGKALLIPLCFSLLIAIVLYPFCRWLELKGWPKSLAIAGSLAALISLFGMLSWLFFWQVRIFWLDVPQLIKKAEISIPYFSHWIEDVFGFTANEQKSWLRNASSLNNVSVLLRSTLNMTVDTLFNLFLVPVFCALYLYHRRTFVPYLRVVAGKKLSESVNQHIKRNDEHLFSFY